MILQPNPPKYTILAVSEAYLHVTNTEGEKILGQGLFKVFPDNPDDPYPDGVKNLTASLQRAVATKTTDRMATQKYDIPIPKSAGSGFEERYWNPENIPEMGEEGNILYIIHHVTDVTQREELKAEALKKVISEQNRTIAELEGKLRGLSK